MKKLYSLIVEIALLLALLVSCESGAYAQLWEEFAHPDDSHVDNSYVPLTIPALFDSSTTLPVRLPTLVVLLEFQDVAGDSTGQHPQVFWRDLVFANGRAGNRPSIADIVKENSNGRLLLVPATAGDRYDGSQDGVVGWVPSQHATTDPFWTQDGITDEGPMRGRAEGIIVADPFFDYFRYDTNGDDLITNDELVILVVFADDNAQVCDYHVGHVPAPGTGCIGIPGGRARRTHPEYIDVDAGYCSDPMCINQQDCEGAGAGQCNSTWNSENIRTHQFLPGVREMVRVSVVMHELGHTVFGHGDLYIPTGCTAFQWTADGYVCNGPDDWYPPTPGVFSTMDSYPDSDLPNTGFVTHFDPWAKIHLGFVKPLVVTHDGTYTLFDAETERSFSTQGTQPEAIIIYDPLREDPYKEYFIIENRSINNLPPASRDTGLAVWLIDENETNWRRAVRLIERNGYNVNDDVALWDGVDDEQGYDLTATSTPRNTNWTDNQHSYVEIYNISPAGPVMTFKVVMPPIFVDQSSAGSENGSQSTPFHTIAEGIGAVPEHPRTIRIAGGSYAETLIVDTPITLRGWRNGSAVIGE